MIINSLEELKAALAVKKDAAAGNMSRELRRLGYFSAAARLEKENKVSDDETFVVNEEKYTDLWREVGAVVGCSAAMAWPYVDQMVRLAGFPADRFTITPDQRCWLVAVDDEEFYLVIPGQLDEAKKIAGDTFVKKILQSTSMEWSADSRWITASPPNKNQRKYRRYMQILGKKEWPWWKKYLPVGGHVLHYVKK